MTDAVLNPLAFATLLTSLYVLRFRGWQRPLAVAGYFGFFAILEVAAAQALPPGAFGGGLWTLCLGLSVPVLVAAFLVWRHEHEQERTE